MKHTPSKFLILVLFLSMLTGACATHGTPTAPPLQIIAASPIPPVLQNTTTPPIPSPPLTQPLLSDLSKDLAGLAFDDFVEASYRSLLSRDPETVLELGLSKVYGTPTNQLTDISDEYVRQTQALESEVLSLLKSYDRSQLAPDQQLTFDIYSWYLADRVKGHEFVYDDYPVNPTVFSIHLDLLQFFTDLRPLTNRQEALDYIACLKQVDTKFAQLINGLQRREVKGVMLPGFLVRWIIDDLNSIATSSAKLTPYYEAFEAKINGLGNLNTEDKQSLLTGAEEAIISSVIPAYQALVSYFEHLDSVTTNDAGVWKFPDGEAYYTYLLGHYTSTDLTADQIHELGLQALDRIHAEMRLLFDQLGYPQDESLPELISRVAADSGSVTGEDIVHGYENIIAAVEKSISSAFDLRPGIGVIVVGDSIGGYYIPPAVDGSRPGMFYARDTGVDYKFSMPTLAYHEAIPGHHYQIAIAQQLDLPSIRRCSDFTPFVEGWALYAERLVAELGIYGDDIYGDIGRLQAEAFRAARLVVDTGIHARQWSFNQAVEFMIKNTGMPEYMMQSEVSRYISIPGQATAYYIGYTKILELRQQVMDELGDRFDLKEFHNLLLGNGAMPLNVLEQMVDYYIDEKTGGG